ncbi:Uma2 family endonuclease [Gordonia amarae]|uniref:Uma2 family endonuclease n=3 Tax=Gordonia amarae TaxID=36821 RepID=A0A857KGU7_9ACTN|nr:Uma2 family endonuclease [Gordonia amarae]QHN20923.1 Uma2 family endonuclease [Gordonia amarae]QHN29774.1 Uma2 family endonuclease [Gordonia amarae]QHN38549.1 Uma2 family endonuclease [Gordonia amarae]GAB05939.1 hypothetical protein GOAMR_46_00350 [Gordonia amarae NBRC 15530]
MSDSSRAASSGYPEVMTAAERYDDADDESFPTRQVRLPVVPPGGFTVADLPKLAGVIDGRFELLDGDIVMMAPATHWHNQAINLLWFALRSVAPEGTIIAREAGVDLGSSVPIPDLVAVSVGEVVASDIAFSPTDVCLAVEVVSPSTKTKDRRFRPAQYADAGIECYWRVENEEDAMVVYSFELLPEGGVYAPTGVHRGRLIVDKPFPVDMQLPAVTWS